MPYFFAAEKILDIGCGVFIWNNEISKKQNYLGLDIDEDIIICPVITSLKYLYILLIILYIFF